MLSTLRIGRVVPLHARLGPTAGLASAAAATSTVPPKTPVHTHNKQTPQQKKKNLWTHVSGFSKFATINDVRQMISSSTVKIEAVLNTSMLPTGSWIMESDVDNIKALLKKHSKQKYHLFDSFFLEPVTDLTMYSTPSKFGIDETGTAILLYNVPRGIEIEEILYIFEETKLGRRGIQKLNFTSPEKKYTSSFLMFCATREDAELAILRSDGMCLGGNHLHMFRYA